MNASTSIIGIFRFFQFCGLIPFNFSASKGTLFFKESKTFQKYTKFVAIAFLFIDIYILWFQIFINLKVVEDTSSKIVQIVSAFSITFSSYLLFLSVFKYQANYCFWMNKIVNILKNLNENNFKRVIYYQYALILFIVSINSLTMYSNMEFSKVLNFKTNYTMTSSKSYFLIGHQNFFIICYHISLQKTKFFIAIFVLIANILLYYNTQVHENLISNRKVCDNLSWLEFVKRLRSEDLEIKDLLDFLHTFFIPVISLNLVWGFFAVLATLAMLPELEMPTWITIAWTIYIFWDILLVNFVCQILESKVTN